MRAWILGAAIILIVSAFASKSTLAQSRELPPSEIELRSHVTSLQTRIDDSSVDVVIRERLVLDLAATLDRAAQGADSREKSREFWGEAVASLDRFRLAHPDQSMARAFKIQAAVLLWARARLEMTNLRTEPNNQTARSHAVDDLENAVKRLRDVPSGINNADDIYSKNARFRLAQCLTDLAEISPSSAQEREVIYQDALQALQPTIDEPNLAGFALLLKAQLLVRLHRTGEAQNALDEAALLKPPIVAIDLLEVELDLLISKKLFADAIHRVDNTTGIEPAVKPQLKSKILIAELKSLPSTADRSAAESALFTNLIAIRKSKEVEARAILMEASKNLKEPGPKQEPEAWDVLAEGAVAAGDLAGAGGLEEKGAERAEVLKKGSVAIDYRLKAGAYYFQGSRYESAEKALAKVVADPTAGPSQVKASLLTALALGRIVSQKSTGANAAKYEKFLIGHLKNFPNDPTADEVRWLLGRLRLSQDKVAAAVELFSAIAHGKPRWLDAQIERAGLESAELDNFRINGDHDAAEAQFKKVLEFLENRLKEAKGDAETIPLDIEISKLELTPNIGRPADAYARLGSVLHKLVTKEQRTSSRWLRIVALAQLSRFVEAEQLIRSETKTSYPLDLFEPTRLLDRTAAESESDLRARRIGFLSNIIIERLRTFHDIYTPEQLAEISLRSARAMAFSGDEAAAKRELGRGLSLTGTSDLDLLRDLAEIYAKLEAFGPAQDVQRLRINRLAPGTLPWLDARYNLALAYYHEGKAKEALHLIDATSILHPELGGGTLKTKFIRLRQRLMPDPSGASN